MVFGNRFDALAGYLLAVNQGQELPNLIHRKTEFPAAANEYQPAMHRGAVEPVAALGPGRLRHEFLMLVVANGFDFAVGLSGKFPNADRIIADVAHADILLESK